MLRQIWDFRTGKALDMASPVNSMHRQQTAESYTATAMFPDGQRAGLGRIGRPLSGHGGSDGGDRLRLTVVIYDLMANEPLSRLHYDFDGCPSISGGRGSDVTERVSFMAVSRDSRYLVAAFQRSPDQFTVFVVFDLMDTSAIKSSSSSSSSSSNTIVLDTLPDVNMGLLLNK